MAPALGLSKKTINKPSYGTDVHLAVTTVLHLDQQLVSLDKKAARIYIVQDTGDLTLNDLLQWWSARVNTVRYIFECSIYTGQYEYMCIYSDTVSKVAIFTL